MSKVIAVANQNCGVAKTTTALNLAAGLARQPDSCPVLLIDFDMKANVTQDLTVDFGQAEANSLYQVLQQRRASSAVVQHIAPNVDGAHAREA